MAKMQQFDLQEAPTSNRIHLGCIVLRFLLKSSYSSLLSLHVLPKIHVFFLDLSFSNVSNFFTNTKKINFVEKETYIFILFLKKDFSIENVKKITK